MKMVRIPYKTNNSISYNGKLFSNFFGARSEYQPESVEMQKMRMTKLLKLGYPYGYNLTEKKVVHTLNEGLIDSAKSVRAILWNAITIVATIITSE